MWFGVLGGLEVRPSEPSQVAAVVLLAFAFAAALSYGAARAAVVVELDAAVADASGARGEDGRERVREGAVHQGSARVLHRTSSFVRTGCSACACCARPTVNGCEGPTVRSS